MNQPIPSYPRLNNNTFPLRADWAPRVTGTGSWRMSWTSYSGRVVSWSRICSNSGCSWRVKATITARSTRPTTIYRLYSTRPIKGKPLLSSIGLHGVIYDTSIFDYLNCSKTGQNLRCSLEHQIWSLKTAWFIQFWTWFVTKISDCLWIERCLGIMYSQTPLFINNLQSERVIFIKV